MIYNPSLPGYIYRPRLTLGSGNWPNQLVGSEPRFLMHTFSPHFISPVHARHIGLFQTDQLEHGPL